MVLDGISKLSRGRTRKHELVSKGVNSGDKIDGKEAVLMIRCAKSLNNQGDDTNSNNYYLFF